MLNFAEQTGSGAVIVVWSFLIQWQHAILCTAAHALQFTPKPISQFGEVKYSKLDPPVLDKNEITLTLTRYSIYCHIPTGVSQRLDLEGHQDDLQIYGSNRLI
jgi:hypothetical protein